MTHFTVKWKPEKAQKKLEAAQAALLPGEAVWFLGFCNNLRPLASEIALTSLRVVALQEREVKFEARYSEIESLVTDANKGTVEVTRRDGDSMLFKMVPKDDLGAVSHYYDYGRQAAPPADLVAAADDAAEAARAEAERQAEAKANPWPRTKVTGRLSRKADLAIRRQCHGDEQPWLILTSSGGAGTLVAFDDRLAIIKTGAMTSLMAGSLGGERSATFHFSDVTGIEYNSGFLNGVLEVLTPSYNGSANRDYWRGSNRSRNADSNDPWTLSNCLPLSKVEYNAALQDVNELKARISRAKQVNVHVVAPAPATAPSGDGLADQLRKLADLRDAGVLTDEEFAAAKARVLE